MREGHGWSGGETYRDGWAGFGWSVRIGGAEGMTDAAWHVGSGRRVKGRTWTVGYGPGWARLGGPVGKELGRAGKTSHVGRKGWGGIALGSRDGAGANGGWTGMSRVVDGFDFRFRYDIADQGDLVWHAIT